MNLLNKKFHLNNQNSPQQFLLNTDVNDELIKSFKSQDFAKCIELSSQLIKFDQNNTLAYSILGLSLSSTGENDKAIKYLNEAISHNPSNSEILNNLANIYLGKKDFEKALKFSKKSISLNSNSSEAYFTLAASLTHLNNLEDALKAFKSVPSLDPMSTTRSPALRSAASDALRAYVSK